MNFGSLSIPALVRLARSIGSRKIRELRARAIRAAIFVALAIVFILAAFSLAMTALALWLASFMELWLALVVVALVLLVLAAILLLLTRSATRSRADRNLARAIEDAEESARKIDPLTIVLGAAVLGFVLSRFQPDRK